MSPASGGPAHGPWAAPSPHGQPYRAASWRAPGGARPPWSPAASRWSSCAGTRPGSGVPPPHPPARTWYGGCAPDG